MFADVIIDIQHEKLDKIFQYRVPESMVDELEPGMEAAKNQSSAVRAASNSA